MAKSLSSILSQIERLQKEAASIQLEVIDRMRKEIAKYSLTPEQLFGEPESRSARPSKPAKKASKARAAKYADGSGNTWGGMGKRPEWLRQALEAGKALEEFLIGGDKRKAATSTRASKPAVKATRKPVAAVKAAAKKRTSATKTARKPRKTVAAVAPAAE
ncbi:DNA-binding protein H-NS [Pelomonas saccharophila]|uniref:DNA-binding protein H-NS n=1 Tax=Roseateles saccharophilus TaxID=304 RepID=A0ABU1YG50_ROSSA|nr:H-NS histone family protein [Roseateles saccharophilus]MDR7267829.1 DNA-binding protein H-NS [Roseateles saccharophilus]